MNKKGFYITTAIDYVNDVIHIGHAYQKVVADVLARYHRLKGEKVFFLTGSDEHGSKAEEAAKAVGQEVSWFVDQIVAENKDQLSALDIGFDRYIRTTDKDHLEKVKDLYLRIKEAGDIYQARFEGFYCLGCEEYKTVSDLDDNGRCPLHPNLPIKKLAENNYFFAWSKYQEFLKDHIRNNPDFIKPKSRAREMLAFLDQGLSDISISRQNVTWGILVPNDSSQTLYVWFDALINYLTGAPKGFWPADLHLLGKDNTRWHALLWPAMLKSANLPLPKTIYAHGFLTLNDQKISKSLGNIIRPKELVEKFGSDGARYLLVSAKTLAGDGDISWIKMKAKYNADLANGLGNLTARLSRLCQLSKQDFKVSYPSLLDKNQKTFVDLMDDYKIFDALTLIWKEISLIDQEINQAQPWQIKNKKRLKEVLLGLITQMLTVNLKLEPFLPQATTIIRETFLAKKIISPKPLFIRK